jgi:multidrug resistance efflux pump
MAPVQKPTEQKKVVDPRQRALALGLEFVKRCLQSNNLDDLYFLLTNDLRALVPFDRSFLVTHVRGKSGLAAIGGLTKVEKTSRFTELADSIAKPVKALDRGILISGNGNLPDEEISAELKISLEEYAKKSEAAFVFFVPLTHHGMILGHLVLEFLEPTPPEQIGILTTLNVAPFIAAALFEKLLLAQKPNLPALIDPNAASGSFVKRYSLAKKVALILLLILVLLAFIAPFPFTVGGEAEIAPTDRHLAFCKIEGLIDKVYVLEGSRVVADQVVATLDSRELDYKIKVQEKQYEILTSEMTILRSSANEDPSKLAESALVELKRKAAWEELQFLKWQTQFLKIKSPVAGIVITKDVDSLVGKKLQAGEPFCEIASPNELSVEVFVPEDRITYVKQGQKLEFYLSGNPRKSYTLVVKEIAPAAEVIARLGSVYRIKAPFVDAPPDAMVGMKGVGKIVAMDSTLAAIASDRLLSRWQRFSLNF